MDISLLVIFLVLPPSFPSTPPLKSEIDRVVMSGSVDVCEQLAKDHIRRLAQNHPRRTFAHQCTPMRTTK